MQTTCTDLHCKMPRATAGKQVHAEALMQVLTSTGVIAGDDLRCCQDKMKCGSAGRQRLRVAHAKCGSYLMRLTLSLREASRPEELVEEELGLKAGGAQA